MNEKRLEEIREKHTAFVRQYIGGGEISREVLEMLDLLNCIEDLLAMIDELRGERNEAAD